MKRLMFTLSALLVATLTACAQPEASVTTSPAASASPATSPASSPIAAVEPSPAPETPATVSQASPAVIAQGSFVAGEHPTQGTAQIIEENGQRYIEFTEDFRTDSGPDLFVILHRSNDVIGTTNPPAHGIQEGDYVTIEPLQQVSGAQRYLIPDTVNVADFQSIAIWCRQFNATFGAASLGS